MRYEDDPHLGQGRSIELQESQMTTLELSFIILTLAVAALGVYYFLAAMGVVPKPPPINLIG